MNYTTETHVKIFNEDTKEYKEIRPDTDGIGCIEVLQRNENNGIDVRFFLSLNEAQELIKALNIVMENNKDILT